MRICNLLLITLFALTTSFQATADVITTIAGGGPANIPAIEANIAAPSGVAIDSQGNYYIAATYQNRVFKINTAGTITIFAGRGGSMGGFSGDGGPAVDADLSYPVSLAIDSADNVFIGDGRNRRIRRVDAATGIITTIAGNGSPFYGGDGGLATSAGMYWPEGIAIDNAGNILFSSDHRIRKIDAASGIITTIAGNGNRYFCGDGGPATSACLGDPDGLTLDTAGNIYVAAQRDRRVRRIDAQTGIITTVAGNGSGGTGGDGGLAIDSQLHTPKSVAFDSAGNLYISDAIHVIRRVDAITGIISTVAGNGSWGYTGDGGPASSAQFLWPFDIAIDSADNILIADFGNNRIRLIDNLTNTINTVAGNGDQHFTSDGVAAINAEFYGVSDIAIDSSGNLYLAQGARIKRVDAITGILTTVAGNGSYLLGDGGPAIDAGLGGWLSIAVDNAGNLFITDIDYGRVRRVDAASGIITTVAGNSDFGFYGDGGPATDSALFMPVETAIDDAGNLFIVDSQNFRIRRVDAMTGIITTVAGNGDYMHSGDGGFATDAGIPQPMGIALDPVGNLYIDQGDRIRRVDAATQIITTIAGNGFYGFSGDGGPATLASITSSGITLDGTDRLIIADRNSHRIRQVDLVSGIITTIAGSGTPDYSGGGYSGDGGSPLNARLRLPIQPVIDNNGSILFVDAGNERIRKISNAPLDLIAPVIDILSVSANITALATSAEGAIVNYSLPTASDNIDPNPIVSCNPTSGSLFVIGDTLVSCIATDTSGNMSNPAEFLITVNAPDTDGDGIPDITDPCPTDATNSCDPNGSAASVIDASTGGNVSTSDGSVQIDVPPGALSSDTTLTITDNGTNSTFEVATNQGQAIGALGVEIGPAGTTFDPPITITLSWPDADNDGIVDGTQIQEKTLRVTKDGIAITDQCQAYSPPDGSAPDCDMEANSFSFQVSSLSIFVLVAYPPVVSLNIPDMIDEGTPLIGSGSFSDLDGESWNATVDYGDGTGVQALALNLDKSFSLNHGYTDDGVYTVTITVTDDNLFQGTATMEITVNNVAPVINAIHLVNDVVAVSSGVSVEVDFSDVGIDDTHNVLIDWGDGITTNGNVMQAMGGGNATANHSYAQAGLYTITVTVSDDDQGTVTASYQYVVIYNQNGGFMTGGGWINSPEGSYLASPSLSGKVSFGFNIRYQKNSSVPSGNTQLQFKVGNLNLHATSFQWLVINGSQGMFKGTGTINGEGNYHFILSSIDGESVSKGTVDSIRIKIETAEGNVIYDSQPGDANNAIPTTAVNGGSIVIHRK